MHHQSFFVAFTAKCHSHRTYLYCFICWSQRDYDSIDIEGEQKVKRKEESSREETVKRKKSVSNVR